MKEEVILVDANDHPLGTMEKMEAHRKGVLHRAFSVFLFNDKDELLLQQRALSKYHSAGLWTNTCCSHPRSGEETHIAALRRLKEEMGIECELVKVFSFVYKAGFENGLTEHEFDHVFTGRFSGTPDFNKTEVNDWKYLPVEEVRRDIKENPQNYTVWFRIAFDKVCKALIPQTK